MRQLHTATLLASFRLEFCDLPKAFTINKVDSVEVHFEEVRP
jgi:hypothetical protein